MPIVRITGPGLAAISLAVSLLWGCLIGERIMVRDTARDRVRVVWELEQLQRQHQPAPVSVPAPRHAQRARMVLA
jgi:hypothetical protein